LKYSLRVFPAIFLVLTVLIFWIGLKHCDHGRIDEAFADVDAGLRNSLSAQQQYLSLNFWTLKLAVNSFPNERNVAALTNYQQIQVQYFSYQSFLDSVRIQLLPLNQPVDPNKANEKILLQGHPSLLMQISSRSDSLRSTMRELSKDRSEVADSIFRFGATATGKYTLNGQSGNFHDLSIEGTRAMLSNLQVAASKSMVGMLEYYMDKVRYPCCFAQFTPEAISPSPFLWSGERYAADICFRGYEPADLLETRIKVNGKSIPVTHSTAHLEIPMTGIGSRSLLVEISGIVPHSNTFPPSSDTVYAAREFYVQVRSAHPQIVQSRPSHFLYAYAANPVSISTWDESVYNSDPRATCSNAAIVYDGGGRYVITPRSLAPVALNAIPGVTFQLEVHPLPDPILLLGDFTSGSIRREELAVQTALQTRFPADFDFPVTCKILNFHLTRFRQREDPEERDNQGSTFNSSVRELLKTAQPGDRLIFDEVRVQCGEEPEQRTIGGLSLRVE